MWKESSTVKSPNSFHLFHGKTRQFYGETSGEKEKAKIRNAALPPRPSLEQNFVLAGASVYHANQGVPDGVGTDEGEGDRNIAAGY